MWALGILPKCTVLHDCLYKWLIQSSSNSQVEAVKSLVSVGVNNLLWSLEKWGWINLLLKLLQRLFPVLWRGWKVLSTMACSLVSILCSTTSSRGNQLRANHKSSFPYEFIRRVGVLHFDGWAPAHHSKEDAALHNRLITFLESGPRLWRTWGTSGSRASSDHSGLQTFLWTTWAYCLDLHPGTWSSRQFPHQSHWWWQDSEQTCCS